MFSWFWRGFLMTESRSFMAGSWQKSNSKATYGGCTEPASLVSLSPISHPNSLESKLHLRWIWPLDACSVASCYHPVTSPCLASCLALCPFLVAHLVFTYDGGELWAVLSWFELSETLGGTGTEPVWAVRQHSMFVAWFLLHHCFSAKIGAQSFHVYGKSS